MNRFNSPNSNARGTVRPLGLKTRPTPKQMTPLAEPWRPLRGAAAHLWWSYYRVLKKREGVAVG